jgi:hypothetical protein
MRRFVVFVIVFCAVVVAGVLLPRFYRGDRAHAGAEAQGNWTTGDCPDASIGWGHWGAVHLCQLRRATLTLNGNPLSVSTTNGSIHVIGEDRQDVEMEASVHVWAPSHRAAQRLLRRIDVYTENGDIHDSGPSFLFFTGYVVNYRLLVPRAVAASLHSTNGGIDLSQLNGKIRFANTNGGVTLTQVSGDVQGSTVNGGVTIALDGDTWQGAGLRASTVNGGISLHLPNQYSAQLDAATVNGGVSVSFPVAEQGDVGKHLNVSIGSGGPLIHLRTVNGGISIDHGGQASGNAD